MEKYDILMLVILLGATLFGAVKGFAWQLASIASIGVSYFVACRFREPMSQSIQADPPWNRFLAMLILYVGTSLVIWVLFRMVSQSIDKMKLKEFDRQVGALFGLAKGALYCTLVTLFAVTLFGDRARELVVQSKSGRYISQVLDKSEAVIPAEVQQVIGPYLEKFDRQLHQAGNQDAVAPWLKDVTVRALESAPWNSGDAGSSPFGVQPSGGYSTPIGGYAAPNQNQNQYQNNPAPSQAPWSQNFSVPPAPAQQAELPRQPSAPWSSVYSSGGTR